MTQQAKRVGVLGLFTRFKNQSQICTPTQTGFFYFTKMRNSNHLSFIEILTLILITLKLTNQIDWSWYSVLAPLFLRELFYLIVKYIIDKTYK